MANKTFYDTLLNNKSSSIFKMILQVKKLWMLANIIKSSIEILLQWVGSNETLIPPEMGRQELLDLTMCTEIVQIISSILMKGKLVSLQSWPWNTLQFWKLWSKLFRSNCPRWLYRVTRWFAFRLFKGDISPPGQIMNLIKDIRCCKNIKFVQCCRSAVDLDC